MYAFNKKNWCENIFRMPHRRLFIAGIVFKVSHPKMQETNRCSSSFYTYIFFKSRIRSRAVRKVFSVHYECAPVTSVLHWKKFTPFDDYLCVSAVYTMVLPRRIHHPHTSSWGQVLCIALMTSWISCATKNTLAHEGRFVSSFNAILGGILKFS